jgi:hypothetical protein
MSGMEKRMLRAGSAMGCTCEGLTLKERTARRDKDATLSGKVMDRPVVLILIVWSRFRSMRLPAIHFPGAIFSTYLSKFCPTNTMRHFCIESISKNAYLACF